MISEYSESRFIFISHNRNAENAKQVIERIQDKYELTNKHSFIDLDYTYDGLQLFESDTLKG